MPAPRHHVHSRGALLARVSHERLDQPRTDALRSELHRNIHVQMCGVVVCVSSKSLEVGQVGETGHPSRVIEHANDIAEHRS